MPLTLNIDPPHVSTLKSHAKEVGVSASRLVTAFIDGLSSETPPPSLGAVIQNLRSNRPELIEKGLLNIAVFGSVARGVEQPGSDVDLLIKVSDNMDAFRLARIQIELKELLGAKVELVTLKEFNAGFDRSAQEDVVVVY